MLQNVRTFLNFCTKGAWWWFYEAKRVAHCCVWRYTAFTFQFINQWSLYHFSRAWGIDSGGYVHNKS